MLHGIIFLPSTDKRMRFVKSKKQHQKQQQKSTNSKIALPCFGSFNFRLTHYKIIVHTQIWRESERGGGREGGREGTMETNQELFDFMFFLFELNTAFARHGHPLPQDDELLLQAVQIHVRARTAAASEGVRDEA